MSLSVSVITAPREGANYLPGTIESLVRAGFDHFAVFNDETCEGPYRNWKKALRWMVESDPSEAYLIFQDDIRVAVGLREWIMAQLWWRLRGVVSLYTAKPNISSETGWHNLDMIGDPPSREFVEKIQPYYMDTSQTKMPAVPNRILSVVERYDSYFVQCECLEKAYWHHILHRDGEICGELSLRDPYVVGYGALAYLLPHNSAVGILEANLFPENRNGIEKAVGRWCLENYKSYWMHTPSLVEHVGEVSSQHNKGIHNGYRMAECFCEDVRELEYASV